MKLNRWSWGYIPVALVMVLIWYEFWQSGAYVAPSRPARTGTRVEAPAPSPAPAVPAPPEGPAPPMVVTRGPGGAGTLPPVAVGPGPVATPGPELPKPPVIDDSFFNSPPPITVSFANAPLDEVIDALRTSFNMPSYLGQQSANLANDRRFTLAARNMPFWEVIRALQGQAPLGFYPAGNVNGLGLVLSTQTAPVYRFQICGPAVVFPTTITFNRTGSAQANPGETGSAGYVLSVGAAVDPRILVARTGTLEMAAATDDTGRTIPLPGQVNGRVAGLATTSNFWTSNISFPALEPRAKRASFKGQVRFAAQLAAGMVTLDDPAARVGQTLSVGDRQIRLERFEVQNNVLSVQFSGDTQPAGGPGPGGRGAGPAAFNCLLIDSRGRTQSIPNPNVVRNFSTATYVAPYRLILRDLTAVRELSFPFELKDIPLP